MADKINAAGYETKPWWPYVRELMKGGGSVTVEQLNVTENGTYTAEAGKAYSPVVVNVAGGSSDFNTAEVTLDLTMPAGVTAFEEGLTNCVLPFPSLSQDVVAFSAEYLMSSEHKVILPLYNGRAYFAFPFANANDGSYAQEDPSKVSLSGDVQFDSQVGLFSVTGDCTITATLEQAGGPN